MLKLKNFIKDGDSFMTCMSRSNLVLGLIIIFCLAKIVQAEENDKYFIGLKGGYSTLTGGENNKYPLQSGFGFQLGIKPTDKWLIKVSFSSYNLFDDSTASSSFSLDQNEEFATRKWKAKRGGIFAYRPLFGLGRFMKSYFGFGGGLINWQMVDPVVDTVLKVTGIRNQRTDFDASELFLGIASSTQFNLPGNFILSTEIGIDYLTGGGVEFEEAVISARERYVYDLSAILSYSFGSKSPFKKQDAWRPEFTLPQAPSDKIDSDGDGVPDSIDKCFNTPPGMIVDQTGCPLDSDGDGVKDGFDDCPNTDRRAAGKVDVYGCPVDSDYDGVADYLDKCPNNKIGGWVDPDGCPIDTDADGVPDGLDDCPNTLVGVAVDRHGCIDLSMLSKPMVMNIDYISGSYEVDEKNKGKLKQLARLLNFVSDVKLEINGYTDNIGTSVANRDISQKRANRVRDYLVMYGIETERIKVFGKGETNFVSSNNTAKGRSNNRRVEIIFFK